MDTLRSLTPTASMRTHLFAAGTLWSLVGTALTAAGFVWILQDDSSLRYAVLLLAAAAGYLKARFILDRTARGIVQRIEGRGDGRCLGGFLSFRSWGLVIAMAVFGRLLRASPLPSMIRGGIYAAIGLALGIAARFLWLAWWRRGHAIPTEI